MNTTPHPTWADLLAQATTEPGRLSRALRAFHHYSLGIMLLALTQCELRGLAPGPLATYVGWQRQGRQVRRGEKALVLCQPVTWAKKGEDGEVTASGQTFVYKPGWFTLTQTDALPGAPELSHPEPQTWQEGLALTSLDVTRVAFAALDGNCLGYARGRTVAVSPLAPNPYKILLHEVAHVRLGHTATAEQADGERVAYSLGEVEAEGVALLAGEALGLGDQAESRGYLQHWLRGQTIPEPSARRIFTVADEIVRAGRPASDALERAA